MVTFIDPVMPKIQGTSEKGDSREQKVKEMKQSQRRTKWSQLGHLVSIFVTIPAAFVTIQVAATNRVK